MIRIGKQPWEEMVAHAKATYPNECVGAMLGKVDGDEKQVTFALRLRNATEGPQGARFDLHPDDLHKTQKEARAQGLDVVGIYHSHPDCAAYFSETDLKNSAPWFCSSYVVLSIQKGEFDHANSWLPDFEQTQADKEELSYG